MSRSSVRSFAGAVSAVAVLAAPPTQGAVMVEVPLAEMTTTADAIVRGTVIRTGTRVVVENGVLEPQTLTWIAVSDWVRGGHPAPVVTVWEPGGRYDETTVTTSGVPQYQLGEEVLVFLRADAARPGLFRTHQMAQGKYRVLPAQRGLPRQVVRDLDDVAFASWDQRGFRLQDAPASARLPLDGLLAEIRKATALRRAGAEK